jgi:predicted nucleic acid-binding protein
VILLDTKVLSELTKPAPSAAVLAWLDEQEPRLALPTIALAELRYGIARLPEGRRKRGLLSFWHGLCDWFAGRTFAFDVRAAAVYGDIVARAERAGGAIGVGDGQIAAIAVAQRFAIATRDMAGFQTVGVTLVDPWRP